MGPGDRWLFERLPRLYDLVMPPARAGPLRRGLALADGPVERVLDIGGGTGRAAKALDVPDRVVVDAARGMLDRVPPGIRRLLASATHLPVADGAADAVIVVDAFHHLPDHDQVVAELYRVLRPGGVLVVRDFDRATRRGRLLAFGEHVIRMESMFLTPAELTERLNAAGFAVERLHGGFTYTVAGRKPGRP